MKVLAFKKDIDKARVTEMKVEIDTGIDLANRIDRLRRARVEEENNLNQWRIKAMSSVQVEIDSLVEDRDNLFKANTEARLLREELIKPLDEEWQKLNLEKESIENEKSHIEVIKEDLSEKIQSVQIELDSISKIKSKIVNKETLKDNLLIEIEALKVLAENEYKKAKDEHDGQIKRYEQSLLEVSELKEQYENGIKINQIEESKNKEKESELIIREKELERRTKNLQRVEKL